MKTLSADWIATQRWFRAKTRPVAGVTMVDRARLGGATAPGGQAALGGAAGPVGEGAPVGEASLVVLEVAYADGGEPDRYFVPLVADREPRDGEGAWREMVAAIAEDAVLPGQHGRFVARSTPALEGLLPSPDDPALPLALALAERRLTVEQSNSSVVLGERLILKLYRLLEGGENPDVEISEFLTAAGFRDTPAVAGALSYEPASGDPAAAAMLQAFVPSRGDAWSAVLAALERDPSLGVEHAADIGRITAAMHAALRSAPEHPAFPARAANAAETGAWRASAERQVAEAVSAVSGAAHDRLVTLAPAIRARFADAFGAATGEAQLSRVHGDYHLGQLLERRDGGFSVIDFEGEPARPLRERRQPSSPLRDVAGMLRSLDYAARTAEAGAHEDGFDAERWLVESRAAFLDGYGGIARRDEALLAAFELEKACYEVRYEANNRPDWLWLPLAAIERLVAGERHAPQAAATGAAPAPASGQ